MAETIFSKIISGELPAHIIAENDSFLSFLDISPLTEGHALVIPKMPVDYLFDMEEEEYQALWLFAKEVSKKIKAVIPCKKIGVAVVGLEVAHAHIHLVPINRVADLDFSKQKLNPSPADLALTLAKIKG